jgi:hypothetical protein
MDAGAQVNVHDLIMIGSGAMLTLAITGTLKWLFSLFDAFIPISKAPEKVRAALSIKTNRALFLSALYLVWVISTTILFALDKSPITRLSILNGAMCLCGLALSLSFLMWEIVSFRRERRREKAAENSIQANHAK